MADVPYLTSNQQCLCTSARSQEWREVWPVVVANSTSGIDDVSAEGVADVSSRTRIGTGFCRTEYLWMTVI